MPRYTKDAGPPVCTHPRCVFNGKPRRFKNHGLLKQPDEEQSLFEISLRVTEHIEKVHAEKRFACEKCSKLFGAEHLRRHHQSVCGQLWTCVTCSRSFKHREVLLTHCSREKHTLPFEKRRVKRSAPAPAIFPAMQKPPFAPAATALTNHPAISSETSHPAPNSAIPPQMFILKTDNSSKMQLIALNSFIPGTPLFTGTCNPALTVTSKSIKVEHPVHQESNSGQPTNCAKVAAATIRNENSVPIVQNQVSFLVLGAPKATIGHPIATPNLVRVIPLGGVCDNSKQPQTPCFATFAQTGSFISGTPAATTSVILNTAVNSSPLVTTAISSPLQELPLVKLSELSNLRPIVPKHVVTTLSDVVSSTIKSELLPQQQRRETADFGCQVSILTAVSDKVNCAADEAQLPLSVRSCPSQTLASPSVLSKPVCSVTSAACQTVGTDKVDKSTEFLDDVRRFVQSMSTQTLREDDGDVDSGMLFRDMSYPAEDADNNQLFGSMLDELETTTTGIGTKSLSNKRPNYGKEQSVDDKSCVAVTNKRVCSRRTDISVAIPTYLETLSVDFEKNSSTVDSTTSATTTATIEAPEVSTYPTDMATSPMQFPGFDATYPDFPDCAYGPPFLNEGGTTDDLSCSSAELELPLFRSCATSPIHHQNHLVTTSDTACSSSGGGRDDLILPLLRTSATSPINCTQTVHRATSPLSELIRQIAAQVDFLPPTRSTSSTVSDAIFASCETQTALCCVIGEDDDFLVTPSGRVRDAIMGTGDRQVVTTTSSSTAGTTIGSMHEVVFTQQQQQQPPLLSPLPSRHHSCRKFEFN